MCIRDRVYTFLASKGFDSVYGARPLRRAILRLMEDPISESILSGEYREGDRIHVSVEGEALHFSKEVETQDATTPAVEPTQEEA